MFLYLLLHLWMSDITYHIVAQRSKPAEVKKAMLRHPPKLPPEIILDILSRLPVKPLLRFKCVCKSWRSWIISDPEFSKLHLRRAKQDESIHLPSIFLSTDPFQSVDVEAYCDADDNLVTREHSFPVRDPEDDFEFVGSCNGLISAIFGSDHQIIVWNPSTGESKQLPVAPTSFTDDKIFYAFGYYPKLDDYRIAGGSSSSSSSELKMEVFNLKGSKWRAVKDLHYNVGLQGSAVTLNVVLNWLASQENDAAVIVSFDLSEEKFLEMVAAPDHVTENWGLELKVLGNCLSVCSSSFAAYFEAWSVKGYGSKASWTKLFSFSGDQLHGCKYGLNVLWVAKDGNILLNYDGLEIIIYNPKEQTVKQFDVPNNWHYFEAITYIESLVSPNAGNRSEAAADNHC